MPETPSKETLFALLIRHCLDVAAAASPDGAPEAVPIDFPRTPNPQIAFNATTGRWTCRRATKAKD